MKKQTETVVYELDPDEQFNVTQTWTNRRPEHSRVQVIRRHIYQAYGDNVGYGMILRTDGPLILKDGSLSTKRRGGVPLHGSSSDAADAMKAMPDKLFRQLVAVGFFEEPGDDG